MSHSNETIIYGIHNTEIGRVILGKSAKGLCWLGFMVDGYKGNGLERLLKFYPEAKFIQDDAATATLMDAIIEAWEYDRMDTIPLDLRGTDFQKKVWEALIDIPKGQVRTYGDIAQAIGRPMAARAVGTAVGENPVSLIVPCHRVVQSSGGIGNYGWGVDIKRNLLLEEEVNLKAA
jgi:O-6-methylguanine DNA methyltransferase